MNEIEDRIVRQRCNCCGKEWDVRYRDCGNRYTYVDDSCDCSDTFSPVHCYEPSISEYREMCDKVNEVERLYESTPCGGIVDADTVLDDILAEDNSCEQSGLGMNVLDIWKNSSDKTAVEQMFCALTGRDFIDYLDRCIEETTRATEYYNQED